MRTNQSTQNMTLHGWGRVSVMAAILALLATAPLFAQNYTLSPQPYYTGMDNNGVIISGGCLWTYQAGTTSPVFTYSTSTGTPNTNPIILDSAGRASVYLIAGQAYQFVLENVPCSSTSHGTTVRTQDDILAVPASSSSSDILGTAGSAIAAGAAVYLSSGAGGLTAGLWYPTSATNAYSSTLPVVGLATAAISAGNPGTIRLQGSITGLAGLVVGSVYYLDTAPGALTVTPPANTRVVGQAETATTLVVNITGPGLYLPATSTITTTGTQTLLAIPAGTGPLTIFANNATILTLQGIAAGLDGQSLAIYSIGAGQVDLVHQSGAAAAANRLVNFATSGNTSLAAGSGSATLIYDATSTRWRLLKHEQGAWITPSFAAGDFTGNGSMTWTVTGGNRSTMKYLLTGRMLSLSFEVGGTTIGGTPSTQLRIGNGEWGGFTMATVNNQAVLLGTAADGGAGALNGATVNLQNTTINTAILLQKAAAAAWTGGAGAAVSGFVSFEVQ